MKKVKKVIITGRKRAGNAVECAKRVIHQLKEWKIDFEVTDYFPVQEGGKNINKIKADMVLCFGGDGSFLRTFQRLTKPIPVLGINCGTKGFLLSLNESNVLEKLPKILSGGYEIEEHSRLKITVDEKEVAQGLNEVIIVPQFAGRLLKYELQIEGKEIGQEADDGLIIATPTGSSAHALSAGGPQIKGNAKVFVVVRMNPIDLNKRPLVINDHSVVKIHKIERPPVQAIVDGQLDFLAQNQVMVSKGTPVKFVRPI